MGIARMAELVDALDSKSCDCEVVSVRFRLRVLRPLRLHGAAFFINNQLHPMQSIFTDKQEQPTGEELQIFLGNTFQYWLEITAYTKSTLPSAAGGWYFSGATLGWSFRISDSRRVIIYLYPRAMFFTVTIVLNAQALEAVLASNVADSIKTALQAAPELPEGRSISLEVRNAEVAEDVKQLVKMKLRS